MDDLRRSLAPITDDAWRAIDQEIRGTLELMLAARRVVDFCGPRGWGYSAVSTGRVTACSSGPDGRVHGARRMVRPMVEFRAPFELSREELDSVPRGASNPDLGPAREAACRIAIAEDRTIFHGYSDGEIEGIFEAATHSALSISEDYEAYPGVVARALGILRNAGIGGPYAIVLGPKCYTGLTQTTVGGFPVIAHIQRLVDGPVVWAPGLAGATVLSLRGGDFELTVGRDFSVGYATHDEQVVELYVEESLMFEVQSPEAAVPLLYDTAGAARGEAQEQRSAPVGQ
jgi:uncharacterized linocin/CFP29 family protein